MTMLGKLNGWNIVAANGRVWLVNPLSGHRLQYDQTRERAR